MSMYDKSYCITECIRKNCERNLKYHKPCTRIYSVSDLGSVILEDTKHLKCPYFIPDYPPKERNKENDLFHK